MSKKKPKDFNVDDLLNDLFRPVGEESLVELFETKLRELDISATDALEIIGISYRALKGILQGTQKIVDFTNFAKLGSFLKLSTEKVAILYMRELEKNFPNEHSLSPEVVDFIKNNFDLAALKKAKFISSVNDYNAIEARLKDLLGLDNILDYRKPDMDIAFSAVNVQKDDNTRALWISTAEEVFKEINNPHPYNRQALIEYFPKIRWYSTKVERGLIEVISHLYKFGVTVIYQAKLGGLHLHGATFAVHNKPCIVLTNYRGFYATLWFAFIHELFHVLFDWDEIVENGYHISDDDIEILSVKEKEDEANTFAREYLFSKEKTTLIKSHLANEKFIEQFAKTNHVHSSLIYSFYAYDIKDTNGVAWARARKMNPNFELLLGALDNPWAERKSTSEYVKHIKENALNL